MTYNITVKNNGALPIPFAITVGTQLKEVSALYMDRPFVLDALCIQGTAKGQLCIHTTKQDVIIEPSPDLEIQLQHGNQESVSNPD